MDLYHIALYFHLLALVVASGATAVAKVAASRRAKARTVAEALEWHSVQMSAAKLFPLMLVLFAVTGSLMVSRLSPQVWQSGFVIAGMTGIVLLLASGVYLAGKGKALGTALEQMAAKNPDMPLPKMAPPALVVALPVINTFLALAVAFDMTTKPATVGGALGIVAGGIALGAALGFRRPLPAPERVPAA